MQNGLIIVRRHLFRTQAWEPPISFGETTILKLEPKVSSIDRILRLPRKHKGHVLLTKVNEPPQAQNAFRMAKLLLGNGLICSGNISQSQP